MRQNPFYDSKTIIRYAVLFIAIIVGMKLTGGGAFVAVIPLAFAAIARKKPDQLIFFILVAVFTLIGNPVLMPKNMVYAVSQRGFMASLGAVTALFVFGRRNASVLKPILAIVPYMIFMWCVSYWGWSPLISYLKLTLFSFIFLGLYASANLAIYERMDLRKFRSMLLAVAIVMLVGSVLLIPFPGIGNMGTEELRFNPDMRSFFRGMTNHSQALGPLVALLGVFLLADLLITIQKMDRLYLVLLGCVPILLLKTASRTAMGAFLAGAMFLTYYFLQARLVRIAWKNRISSLIFLVAAVAGVAILAVPSVRQKTIGLILKYETEGRGTLKLTKSEILKTRQGKIDHALYYWRQSPYIGNGFQVSEDMENVRFTSFKELLTAPVEKSTWIYAILEEGGIIGEILFIIFVLVGWRGLISQKAYTGAACFATMIVINLGEFTVFSMSGSGGSFWAFLFVALVMDARKLQGGTMMPPPPPRLYGRPGWAY